MRTLVVNALRLSAKRTAIGRHLEYLAQQWSMGPQPFDRIIFLSPAALQVDGLGSTTTIELRTLPTRLPYLLWEQWKLPRAASGAALLFSEYTCPLWYRGHVVVANHGIYEAIPESFSRWQRMRFTGVARTSARRADRVIANSLSTRADLVRFFGVPDAKIDVVYPGPADLFFEPHSEESLTDAARRIFGGRVPFVIFVGKLATRRHVPNLIEAFARVRAEQHFPHHLLIVGPNVNLLPLEEIASHHGVGLVMRYLPHLDQDVLAKLYAAADVFALPSNYEGISWTMFEAMASGTAVLAVDHPALAEGGADAVLSMPTPSVDDLVKGLTLLLTDTALRHAYEEKGRARAKRFSLAESARRTMEILDQTAPGSDPRP
ncbi:MAG: glycosyltransferase family 4 protein [Betaproteobacteria bacterium]|nr:glycosyltransferase family 4 protein [Betaproteobacteria bacterium]